MARKRRFLGELASTQKMTTAERLKYNVRSKPFVQRMHHMLDYLVLASCVFLCLSKVPDFVTTYRAIKRSGSISLEGNVFARMLFRRLGLIVGMVVVGAIYVISVCSSLYLYFISDGVTRAIYGNIMIAYNIFVLIVQLQTAAVNRGRPMRDPLHSVVRIMGRIYRRSRGPAHPTGDVLGSPLATRRSSHTDHD